MNPNESAVDSARVIKAEFLTSVFAYEALPQSPLPEIAVIGRSNVGKSSLINHFCNRRSLARSSRTPGRTQSLNYFDIEYQREGVRSFCFLVDFPGYGYAKVPGNIKKTWAPLFTKYLLEREALSCCVLLIDVRREVREEELYLADLARQQGLVVVLTKADKVSKREVESVRKSTAKNLRISPSEIFSTSLNKSGMSQVQLLRERVFRDLKA